MLTFSLPFFLLFFTTTTIAQPYKATDLFFIDCGSSTASSSNPDQRWVSDENSKFMSSNIDTTSITFTSDLNETPYSTARVFYASFNYAFPVSLGPKYLRLHFYPATNSQLNTESFLFSVSSNGYSLLTNFSAFQAAFFIATTRSDAGVNGPQVRPFIKEFLIYVKDTQILNVTITPSRNSFAFINGIEIVSMPENLYFNTTKTKYLNQLTTVIDNHKALENIYRLNMGGSQIPVHNDTGMYRSWDQDSYYMNGTEVGVKPLYNNSIMYTMETPNYIAPELVYQTQRSMGRQTNNLTWILPVDSGFYHMLRLHFCNIIPQYNKSGVVVFSILINNQTAEQRVDLFNWTQGTGYPVFKDYMVFVHDPNGKRGKQDLWLVMHPNPLSELYFDAYLNGLEVFKLSLDKSLASPNPELSITTTRTKTVKDNNKKKETPYVVIIGGIVEALVLLPIIAFIVIRQRRRLKHYGATKDISSYRCRCFSLKEVKTATEEFNENFIIGNGGFGKVYKGCLDNATTVVAIKQLDSSSRQGFQEFRTKIEMLSKLRHVQLVSLIGYCDDEGEMILVYDYMAHGTLREHLYNTNNPPLSWKRRLDICIGVAKGLHYLHSGGKRVIFKGRNPVLPRSSQQVFGQTNKGKITKPRDFRMEGLPFCTRQRRTETATKERIYVASEDTRAKVGPEKHHEERFQRIPGWFGK
ncbi:hypothetical protein QVD17_24769 [Tagetes erecta]|uniref:Protein kinase domain-containing protein n=1 Tax=Tagetes erecta TaxID=13708 RepID=A0AAD8NV65_TARER|nr:hypothetical protein QVD17_24769 [Tagetes erecta]